MKKVFFISVGIAALFGAGCLSSGSPPLSVVPPVESPQPLLPPVFETITTSSTQGRLWIHTKTPRMTDGLTSEMRDAFNARMTSDVAARINTFTTEFSDPEFTDPRGDEAPPWMLSMDYSMPTSTGRIQSVVIDGYQYTGGAHGLAFEVDYLFDLKTGSFLTLSDLFEPGTDYLTQLSSFTRAELLTREYVKDTPNWVMDGTAASSTNFSIAHVTPDGIAIYFSDYQVAAHAVGPQTVVIPWSTLTRVKQEYAPQ